MEEQFNPYRQWLGRDDGLPPASPREWLGLPPGESNPEAIARAADILTARVRRIRPGPNLMAWRQLLDRIAEAKDALLRGDDECGGADGGGPAVDSHIGMTVVGQVQGAAGDVALPPGVAAASAEPEVPVAPAGPAASDFRPVALASLTPGDPQDEADAHLPSEPPPPAYRSAPIGPLNIPLPPLAKGLLDPVLPPLSREGGPAAESDPMAALDDALSTAHASGRRDSTSDRATLLVAFAGVVAVVGFAAWLFRDRWLPRLPWLPATSLAESSGGPGVAPEMSLNPTPPPAVEPSAGAKQATPVSPPSANPPAVAPVIPAVKPEVKPEVKTTKPSPTPPPSVFSKTPPPVDGPLPLSPSAAAPPDTIPPSDSPPGKSDPPAAAPANIDPAGQAEFQRQTGLARAAMTGRDIARSRRALAAASKAAQTPDEQAEVKRLETLTDKLSDFWKAMAGLLAGMAPAQEITVGNDPMIVVESTSKSLTLRYQARSVKYTLQNMPRSVVEAIADGMPNDPSSLVLLGTFLAFDPQGNRQTARQLWEEAAKKGVDTGDLLRELDRRPGRPQGESK